MNFEETLGDVARRFGVDFRLIGIKADLKRLFASRSSRVG